jgi:hypothetical protein
MQEARHPVLEGSPLLPRAILGKLIRRGREMVGLKARRRAKRYIPPDIGLDRFFAALRDRHIRYVLLRWFDELPQIRPDGDVDLLIHDDDVGAVSDLFVSEVRGTACDLFSVSGLPGTSYRGIPYLPPDKAVSMLARAGTLRNLIRIPSPEDHFLSLAYHAVYQKGLRSGLPTSGTRLKPVSKPGHDYAADLAALAADLGIDVPITMECLDEYLAGRGWRPSPEMLPALAKRNPWIGARFCR